MSSGISEIGGSIVSSASAVSKASDSTKSNATKSKYLTVQDGEYSYTYVVIGDNFKVLIGKVPLTDDEKKQAAAKQAQAVESTAAVKQTESQVCQSANAPYQNSQDYIACQQVVAQAKEKGMLPFL
jgi:hypothetical protein